VPLFAPFYETSGLDPWIIVLPEDRQGTEVEDLRFLHVFLALARSVCPPSRPPRVPIGSLSNRASHVSEEGPEVIPLPSLQLSFSNCAPPFSLTTLPALEDN